MDSVPFDPDDIPGYVGRLFDYPAAHPDVYRLVTWAGLERPNAVAELEADSYGAKLAAIADAQRAGTLDASLAPADLLALRYRPCGIMVQRLRSRSALRLQEPVVAQPPRWGMPQSRRLGASSALKDRPRPAVAGNRARLPLATATGVSEARRRYRLPMQTERLRSLA
jgi:hypothetical protein